MKPTAADLFERLSADHREILSLFDQAEQYRDPLAPELVKLYQAIRELWRRHGAAEEGTVYPLLEREPASRPAVHLAIEAHDTIDSLFGELDALSSPSMPGWQPRFRRLRREVTQHFSREEADIFPYLRRLFRPAELDGVAERFERALGASAGVL
jgi:hemerythrin superfamily protein